MFWGFCYVRDYVSTACWLAHFMSLDLKWMSTWISGKRNQKKVSIQNCMDVIKILKDLV